MESRAGNACTSCAACASIVQYSCALNAEISSSRSTISRSAGLWTRPAERPAADLLPKQRREVEPHEIIERAAGLLGVDERLGQVARLPDGFLNRPLRDLVEDHAMHGLGVEHLAILEHFEDVPRDRFALAVGVGRQIHRIGSLDGLDDLLDVLLVLVDELVLHREAMLWIDGAFLRHEVTDVTIGR